MQKPKPIINEVFTDNGQHSHWELIDSQGNVLWTQPDVDGECNECDFGEMKQIGFTQPNGSEKFECNICKHQETYP